MEYILYLVNQTFADGKENKAEFTSNLQGTCTVPVSGCSDGIGSSIRLLLSSVVYASII